jgi:hypothetical protein
LVSLIPIVAPLISLISIILAETGVASLEVIPLSAEVVLSEVILSVGRVGNLSIVIAVGVSLPKRIIVLGWVRVILSDWIRRDRVIVVVCISSPHLVAVAVLTVIYHPLLSPESISLLPEVWSPLVEVVPIGVEFLSVGVVIPSSVAVVGVLGRVV